MTTIQKILTGINVALQEDGPAALQIEIETSLRAMSYSNSEYHHEDIALAVFGSRQPEDPEPDEAEADA